MNREMTTHPAGTVSLRLMCLFQPREKGLGKAHYTDRISSNKLGVPIKSGRQTQQAHAFFWTGKKPENLWQEFFSPDFSNFWGQCMTPFDLCLDFRQLRCTWMCKAPTWVRHTPLKDRLVTENDRLYFLFSIHDITAFVFSNGFLSVQIDIEPRFSVDGNTVLETAFLLNQLTLPGRRFKQVFKNQKHKDSFHRRFAAKPGGDIPKNALPDLLCGEEVSFAELLKDMVGSDFEPVTRKFLPWFIMRTSGPDTANTVFSSDEISRFLSASQGLNPNYQLDRQALENNLYTDGRSKIIWGVSMNGAGCMVKLTDPVKDVFLGTPQFEKRTCDIYMPLYVACLYLHYGIVWLQQALSECNSIFQLKALGEKMDEFRTHVSIEYPSKENYHNNYFQHCVSRLAIRNRWETVENTWIKTSKRLETQVTVKSEAQPPSLLQTENAVPIQSCMSTIWENTRDWFVNEGTPQEAFVQGILPHNFSALAPDNTPVEKMINGFKSCGIYREAPGYPDQLRLLENRAANGTLTWNCVHKSMIKAWFPWMPDHWFEDPKSAGHLHEAMKTLTGGHSTAISLSGRPPSVAGIYIFLCHALWYRLNKNRADAHLHITQEELEPGWVSAVNAKHAAFLARQSPTDTRRTLQFLEKFFLAFFLSEATDPPISHIQEMRFEKQGASLVFELPDPDILDGLSTRVQSMVGNMTRQSAIMPAPGSTTAALVHLCLRLLMGDKTAFGSPGGIRVDKKGQLILYGGAL